MSFVLIDVSLRSLPGALRRAKRRYSLKRDGVLALPMQALDVLADLSPAVRMRGLRALPESFRAGLVGAEVATWGAVSPSLLPHNWWSMTANVAGLQAIGHAVATVTTQALRPVTSKDRRYSLPAPLRLAMTGVTTGVFLLSVRGRLHQEELVESDDNFKVSNLVAGLSLGSLGYGAFLLAGEAIQRFIDAIENVLGRKLPPVTSWPLAIVGGGALLVLVGDRVILRGYLASVSKSALDLDREYMRGAVRPFEPERSGSPESNVDWNSMGRQGRAVVSGGPRRGDIAEVLEYRAEHEPIRVFIGLHNEDPKREPDFEVMAEEAIAELHRTGAFERSHIAVMSAAGTGWINDFHTSGFEFVTRGDCAIAAMQYSFLPSAYAYLADHESPVASSRALVSAILREIEALPEDARPKVYVGGESLGAYGVSDAFESVDEFLNGTAGGVFTGVPGFARNHSSITKAREKGSPQRLPLVEGGRHIRFTAHPDHLEHDFEGKGYANAFEEPRYVFAQHASDPVVWWEPSLAWRIPDWLTEPGSRGEPAPEAQHLDVLDSLRWMPLVTFWQVGIDQLASQDYPSPHGHNYHDETVAYWNTVVHGEDGDGRLTPAQLRRASLWIHRDATKLRKPPDGFPSKHGY